MNKMRDQTWHELNIMQSALGQRPRPARYEFQFDTAYPPDCLVISGIGASMYQYTFLRNLWNMYCNTLQLHTWMQCRPHHAYLFFAHLKTLLTHDNERVFRHVSMCPNPSLHVDRHRRGTRPRDTDTRCTVDDICQ